MTDLEELAALAEWEEDGFAEEDEEIVPGGVNLSKQTDEEIVPGGVNLSKQTDEEIIPGGVVLTKVAHDEEGDDSFEAPSFTESYTLNLSKETDKKQGVDEDVE